MLKETSYPVIDGQVKKVEVITYSNGLKSRRLYERATDVVPFEVKWLKRARKPRTTSFGIICKLAKHAVASAIGDDIRQEVANVFNYKDMLYSEVNWHLNLRLGLSS